MVRALASHQSGLGLIPARCHMWVEVAVCSRPATMVVLWVLRFSTHRKNQSSKFNQSRRPPWKPAKGDLASSLNNTIYIHIYLFFRCFAQRIQRVINIIMKHRNCISSLRCCRMTEMLQAGWTVTFVLCLDIFAHERQRYTNILKCP